MGVCLPSLAEVIDKVNEGFHTKPYWVSLTDEERIEIITDIFDWINELSQPSWWDE